MTEAKQRALSINKISNCDIGLAPSLVADFCFLQLRKLCELISLGCMVAHGDIAKTRSTQFQKLWNAGQIIQHLERLHADFYPSPRKFVFYPGGLRLDDYDQGYLQKDDLLNLYALCGDALHRGSLRQISKSTRPERADYHDIQDWGQKILNLLSQHLITRIGGNFHFVVALAAAQVGGDVMVSIAESAKP